MLKEGMFIQGRYEVVGKIGTGGMADVYKAKDHKLNRFVAVKVLKPEFRNDKAFISKFRAEAQAAAGLAHLNIVNIYDVGEDHGISFIVMELVEGITLKEYIAKKGKLAVREATSIAIQVSQGLEAAHNSGIIHRDVKPQNIIISTDGRVKVTDFGIARATSGNTINTAVMGSVHYSSPEQARGGYSDAKSDIYSLGITMYEMLTGHVPFDGDTTVAIAIKHLQEEIKSPEVYVPNLPHSTVQIIMKCTQKSPDRRYANMSELISDLKESLVNPDGDFVHIANTGSGQTIKISKEELSAIKEGYIASRRGGGNPQNTADNSGQGIQTGYGGQPPIGNSYQGGMPGGNGYPGNMPGGNGYPGNGPAGNGYPGNGPAGNGYPGGGTGGYDPYAFSRAYGNRGYDYEESYEGRHSFRDDEKDRGILNPRLEKIVTVGSIVITVLIAFVFLALIANALGIVKFSLADLFRGGGTHTEAPAQNEPTPTPQQTTDAPVSQPATDAGAVVTDGPMPETQAQTPTEAPQTPITEYETDVYPQQGAPVTVPNVVNYDFDTAQDMMMQAGFYVQRQDDASSDYAPGIVMEQSVTGTATPGTTVILIVSAGSAAATDATSQGTWMCNAQLLDAPGYNGELARLELVQGGNTRVLIDGQAITFPYDLVEQGAAGMDSGEVILYVLDAATGTYKSLASYVVPFERVD